jgi:sphingomyelin phosphodiesterase 2
MLVTRLADGTWVVNVHPLANRDGDWSPGNRHVVLQQRQLVAIADMARSIAWRSPVIVCGDFNVARSSRLWQEFMAGSGLSDAFAGKCPPTFRIEYLPPGRTPHCIDFILVSDEAHVSDPKVILDDARDLPGGVCYLSDHVGLSARVNIAPAQHSPSCWQARLG